VHAEAALSAGSASWPAPGSPADGRVDDDLSVDRADDDADRAAGRQLTCPTLQIRSTRDNIEQLYGDPLAVWRPWATDTRGPSHRQRTSRREEAPEALSSALVNFLTAAA
jgi:haloacetate dehalogenase